MYIYMYVCIQYTYDKLESSVYILMNDVLAGKQSKCLYASYCTRTVVLYELVKVRKLPQTLQQVMTGLTAPSGTSTSYTFTHFFTLTRFLRCVG